MTAPSRSRLAPIAIGAALLLIVTIAWVLPAFVASRLRAAAVRRGFEVRWSALAMRWPAGVELRDLRVLRSGGDDTLVVAERASVALQLGGLLTGHPRPSSVLLSRALLVLPTAGGAEADTLAPDPGGEAAPSPAVAARVRQRAQAIAEALLTPARQLPALTLLDVSVRRGPDAFATIDALQLRHERRAVDLAVEGTLHRESEIRFDLLLFWERNDHLTARAQFGFLPEGDAPAESVVVRLDGRVTQDRHGREVRIADGTRLDVGELSARLSGAVAARGPRFRLAVQADSLTAERVRRSLPPGVLGPLAGLDVRGYWDWSAGFDLDLARPDSVYLRADVIPHGLRLDASASRPALGAIAGPFIATLHLPHDRLVMREVSDANPDFRPFAAISPFLRDAVLTNEDGGFWHHRGFNTEAIGRAVAANLRSGSYGRGAGTITMQLARNLWLGHRRTLARKGQEVVLAWLLEHETGVTKERMLEVYLNIVEWGPEVYGANQAARYYFDEDAAHVTVPEALFLAILLPSPSRWRSRLGADGTLRPYARAQMQFIARKMLAKGWLDSSAVPVAESLDVRLRGPARAMFEPPAGRAAPADSEGISAAREAPEP